MCDAASMRFRIASIDLGTVSSRLLLATVEDGVIVDSNKHTVITNHVCCITACTAHNHNL